ncbi:MAG: hypothetical protein HYS07_08065 [Chlamydiae bacterium]|nr:hypothetical protein [Chlamydiota bacterium]MBI3277684.1 hypothetical protein [Chlamydiota bacterium]
MPILRVARGWLCSWGIALKDLLNFYEEKYKKLSSNLIHIQKSLVYFEDVEDEEMPKMLRELTWNQIKSFFEQEAKKLIK